jgi:nicotinate-nucleotide adenylyltransferase
MSHRPRTGWFGGTFDPIHLGHLDVARAARQALWLDRVVLVPARTPPHRPRPAASATHRLAMIQLAGAETGFDVSSMELDSDGPSFTAVTLDRLAAAGTDLADLALIMGADAFAGIMAWHRAADVLARVVCAVVSRPGHPAGSLPDRLPALAGDMVSAGTLRPDVPCVAPRIVLIEAPTAPVSSTAVRAAAAAGHPLGGLVPPPVEAYIRTHQVYGPPQGVA